MRPWQAVVLGHLAITPLCGAGLLAPICVVAIFGEAGAFDNWAGELQLALCIAALIFGAVLSWFVWSWAVTHWRLWAYRRVDDLDALKREAVGGLIWPDNHPFGRFEIRSRDQDLELSRLEAAAAQRNRSNQKT